MNLLEITGDVDHPRGLSLAELAALPAQVPDVAAVVPGRAGAGVRLSSVLDAVGARGAFLTLVAADGFSICVPRDGVAGGIVVYRLGDEPLPAKQGGPIRFLLDQSVPCKGGVVDACANVKGLAAIRVTAERAPDTHAH